ncbi:type VI secretion protein, partial [Streptomyces cyaneofuscatus]
MARRAAHGPVPERGDRYRPRHEDSRSGGGGVPDGLLVGLIGFLFAATLLAWTATGLAGLLAHGSWPDGVTFTQTPLALRELATGPQDLPGAWPHTPAAQLSGYGLFWGLFIGELMVLVVLTVFVLGSVARWRAVRERRREERRYGTPHEAQEPHEARGTYETYEPQERYEPREAHQPHEVPAPSQLPTPTPASAPPPPHPPLTKTPTLPSPRTPLLVYAPARDRRPTVVQ